MRLQIAVMLLALAISSNSIADDAALRQVLTEFYQVHQQSAQGGIPDAKQRAKYAPYTSSGLEKLFADGDAAEDRFVKANKASPPLVEGDLFSSNFEGISAFAVDSCTDSGNTARCKVKLHYADAHPRPQDKPVDWMDIVTLVKTSAGWRVDDIAFGGNWDFGNHGTLKAILKDVIANAGG